ncbi:benzoate/H(+) symporter BenE family transporter [Enterobacteriaceae bacterium BIT-l23]|uniref:Benzoate/H(+) symporter BenE family transporter n=1 Tax=Jejubacter calystegiae TaxID=2579935 RepID=A0A4P8YNX6_9ENTR|nr:benzoate/H(+) symporter BenE family transporter [Jejubacter calystegiae]NUU66431.1 benzoate/H(+) symporter BenE family transporter [Enterobacteriaceae bacterium BIT-l23]QCT21444.1 benzoate/H(+) symporter BenE family transporter [Jejubacter calystegiae]
MRLAIPFPPSVPVAGFVAVLVGYASSAAIIWQAASVAGATNAQVAGWMTMLGLAMGLSTLLLSLRWRAPVLTAWSTPGAALLVTSLPGHSLGEATGVFIFCGALITLCGVTGLFARLMKILPHSLCAAMLAGILLRFGLEAFGALADNGLLCGVMLAAWLLVRTLAPRYAVIAALLAGLMVAFADHQYQQGLTLPLFVTPTFTLPQFTLSSLIGVGVPYFLVTMASQNAPGLATLKASGYQVPTSPLLSVTGLFTLVLAPFGAFSVAIAAITASICQGEEAHPDPARRWQAACAAGVFYLLAGLAGGGIVNLMTALPDAWIKMLAGLALLGALSGSLHQALGDEKQRDAAIVTFLIVASGVTLWGVGSAFWGLVGGGLCHAVLSATRRP